MRGPLCIKGSARHVNVLHVRLTSSSEAFSHREERRWEENVFLLQKHKDGTKWLPSHLLSKPHRWPLFQSICKWTNIIFQPLDGPFFDLVAILCQGGFQLVPGAVLWLVAIVVVVERSLGNNGADARGVRGGGGGEAQLSLPLPSLQASRL